MLGEKQALRKSYYKMRKALSRDSVEQRSYKIIGRLKQFIDSKIHTVLFYVPINNEVDLLPLAKELFLKGKTVLFPKLVDDKLVPYWIHDLFFDFKPGAYNIPEPDTEPYDGIIDLAFIPGVVFSRDGHRIGYGKGYFDRYLCLKQVKTVIGVGYDFQLMTDMPHSEWDCALDRIITENETVDHIINK